MIEPECFQIKVQPKKNLYFASDFHLGAPNFEESRKRELKIIEWLDYIYPTCQELYLVGDLFDFWFEYRHTIPKGFTRFLGKIAYFVDQGIPVHFFTGNHDIWMFDYFQKELGVIVHRNPICIHNNNRKILVGHGDGLGPGDHTYKLIKKIFENKVCQWLFARFHPNFGIGLANYCSASSRKKSININDAFDEPNEWLVRYCKSVEKLQHYDYYVFGHRHLPIEHPINEKSTYFNLGEWMSQCYYGVFDGDMFQLLKLE